MESDVDIMILLNCDQKGIMQRRKEISRIASRIGLKNNIMVSLLARNSDDYENFDIRSDNDYNDCFVISKKEVGEQISNAQYFYDRVEGYVVAQIKDGG